MDRPSHFLISYSGRVGSTALIDTLKQVPGFNVPLFEELDYWWIEQHHQLEEHTADNIHQTVDYLYRHLSPGFDEATTSVGFKWRIWGDPGKVAAVLRDNGVVVLNMLRCDMMAFISSLYVSDRINREFNAPQFMLRDAASEEERARILFKYRVESHEVDLAAFFELFEEQLAIETARTDLLCEMQRAGCRVVTIFYEDFAYKRFAFLNALLRVLGHAPLERLPVIGLQKVSSPDPSERFTNRAELLESRRLGWALRAWDQMAFRPELPVLALGSAKVAA